MTMTPGELERKVSQLDNDVHDIYALIRSVAATQSRHGNRLDEIQAKLDNHGERLDGIDGRLDGIDGRLDTMDGRLSGLETSMAEVLRRLPG